MIGTHNVIARGYDDIDSGTLWDAVELVLPRLIIEVAQEMRSLGG